MQVAACIAWIRSTGVARLEHLPFGLARSVGAQGLARHRDIQCLQAIDDSGPEQGSSLAC